MPLFGEHRMAEMGASEGHVFDGYEVWLSDKIAMLQPDHVFVESVFLPRSTGVAQRLYGLRAITIMLCHRDNIRLRSVPTQTVQAFFTGQGRWPKGQKKQATIAACRTYGWMPQSDNQADALGLWLFAEHETAPHLAGRRSGGPLFAKGAAA